MTAKVKTKFVRMVKAALDENDMSLRELARRSRLDVSFLSKIMNGFRNPPSNENDIKRIARSLKIEPEKLIIAAGRIPASLEGFFDDDGNIERIMASQGKNDDGWQKQDSDRKNRRDLEQRIQPPEIEDELL